MDNEYSIIIESLTSDIEQQIYNSKDKKDNYKTKDTQRLSGVGFFEKPFVKNQKENQNNGEGVSTTGVTVCSDERELDSSDLWLFIRKEYNHFAEDLYVEVSCSTETFNKIISLNLSDVNIILSFQITEWLEKPDYIHGSEAFGQIKNINVRRKEPEKSVHKHKQKDIENYLIRNFCGDSKYGQAPKICKEFASTIDVDKSHEEISESVRKAGEILESARYTLQKDAYAKDELEKLSPKEKNKAMDAYNNLHKRKDATSMFKDGLSYSLDEIKCLSYEYLEQKEFRSSMYESILIDLLIACEIGEIASYWQYHKLISVGALLNIPHGIYEKTSVQIKEKSTKKDIIELVCELFINLLGIIITGLISWWISGLIAGDNDTARIVLFGTLYAAHSIKSFLNENKSEKIQESNQTHNNSEEKYFYKIKAMCDLHKHTETMNVKLITHLMYKLEEQGITFNAEIYQLLQLQQ